jgi:hypothetical protein
LYDLAVRIHPDLEEPGFRSFHARYVLPLKREQARAEGRPRKPRTSRAPKEAPARTRRTSAAAASEPVPQPPPRPAAGPDLTAVRVRAREALMRLARQVAVADSRADLVDALAGVEDMVEEIVSAARPAGTA